MKTKNEYSWNQALTDVGFFDLPEIPAQYPIYYSYKKDEVREFNNRADALNFSNKISLVWKSSPDRDQIIKDRIAAENKAFDIWYSKLREYWNNLSNDMFELCYSESYDRGHSSGYNEVAYYMHDVVRFAENIMRIKQ